MSSFSRPLSLALYWRRSVRAGKNGPGPNLPVSYWIPGSPFFGGDATAGQSSNTYGNFPSFDGSDVRGGGFSSARYNFPNGWFVGSESGGLGLSMNGINPASYQGVQAGYNFQNSPVRVFAGLDTLKYNTGIGNPFAPFDNASNSVSGYSAHAGVEYRPTSNPACHSGSASPSSRQTSIRW